MTSFQLPYVLDAESILSICLWRETMRACAHRLHWSEKERERECRRPHTLFDQSERDREREREKEKERGRKRMKESERERKREGGRMRERCRIWLLIFSIAFNDSSFTN